MDSSFIHASGPLNACMVLEKEIDVAIERIRQGIEQGADAFGIQFEVLNQKYFTQDCIRTLIDACQGRPLYAAYYRGRGNEGKNDDELADGLRLLARCGAKCVDVIGDMFGPEKYQIDCGPEAVQKQKTLIHDLRALGAEVLMSSHVMEFRDTPDVLAIAREQIDRGADIAKIVTAANTPEEEQINLYTTLTLSRELGHPFLFLSIGEYCRRHRRLGGFLGCRMWLTVAERDEYAVPVQPLTSEISALRQSL